MGIRDRSESRDGYAVRVLAVHSSEGIDHPRIDDAAALRDATWWEGSSHAIADNDPGSLLTPAEGCVPYDRASWTLRSGNRWSENIELIAQAGWTRAQWLARPTLLDNCARWLADRSRARGIPLVKLTPQQYRAGQWGVIGHNDHTIGYSDGTHWDPGPGFPWDVVLDKARKYAAGQNPEDDDMPLNDADKQWLRENVGWSAYATMPYGPDKGKRVSAGVQLREMYLQLQNLYNNFAPGIAGVHHNKPMFNTIIGRIPFIEEAVNQQAAAIEALQTTIRELAAAGVGGDFDVDGLLAKIEGKLESVRVRLDVTADPTDAQPDEPA